PVRCAWPPFTGPASTASGLATPAQTLPVSPSTTHPSTTNSLCRRRSALFHPPCFCAIRRGSPSRPGSTPPTKLPIRSHSGPLHLRNQLAHLFPMEYRLLGRSGLKASALSFGSATFGGGNAFFKAWGDTGVEEARRMIALCTDA